GAVLASSLLIAIPVARADHDTVPWATFGNVVAYNLTRSNRNPTIVTDSSNHAYLFYVRVNTLTGVANVNVTKFNTTGGTAGGPQKWFDKQVNDVTNVVYTGSIISAVIDHSGNIYVAWTRLGAAPAYEDIYVSKSSDGGNTWLPAVRVGNPTDGTHDQFPTIAAAPNGNVFVAWTSYKPVNWFYNIEFATSTNGGNTFTNVKNVSGQGRGGQAIINGLAVDSQGRIALPYTAVDSDFNVTGNRYHINYTWSDDGMTWAAPAQFTPRTGLALYPTVAIDAKDRVHLAWLDGRRAYSNGIGMWYTKSLDRGATWSPQMPVGNGLSQPNTLEAISVHGDTVMVTWVGSRRIASTSYAGLGYAISADAGDSWYSEQWRDFSGPGVPEGNITWQRVSPDANGTFWAAVETYSSTGGMGDGVDLLWWNGPPSTPTATVSVSGNAATVSWTAPPERDVAGYDVWRSTDGTNWVHLTTVGSATTSYMDSGLANGTYWYQVRAVDTMGTWSHPSPSAKAQVGPTLEDQNNALRNQLNNANSAIAQLQNSLNSANSAITQLQNALTGVRSEAQSASNLNTILLAVIIVLLIVVLVVQFRKPKNPRPMMMTSQPGSAPPGPQGPGDDL
ncbi:MAG: fibronectin type III domain-containing protein, partial [Thermoplasmata archaeon]|nr:fibronectin type III domain-containing protein [Thermoplasmata archaeon]